MSLYQNIPHDSARTHVTGKSVFIDDRALLRNEIHVDVVYSQIACGKIRKINIEEALKLKGVVGIYTAKDFHHNLWGTIVAEQPLLALDRVNYNGEPVVIIAAETRKALNHAKKLITIDIDNEEAIFTIDKAIERKSFITPRREIKRGDAKKAIQKSPQQLKGFFENGGQEHFYLESQASIAYPLENEMIEVHSSSQHPSETQHVVAHALGLSYHQVTCIVKRMGGGFGGKESQAAPIAAYAALAAKKLNRPARIVLTKDDDMKITGKRHPFKSFYEVGFDESGKILGLTIELYSDGGAYSDLSSSIMERAMLHSDGCYYLENVTIGGTVCRTNNASNTAFRGFGGPQGTAVIENIMQEIAITLKLDAAKVREINLYQDQVKNITPYGQAIDHNPLPAIFTQLMKESDYQNRREEIRKFNLNSPTKIRGMAITGTKFGIAFTAKFLNQGNALVNLHRDGTVQVSTGATEMGQGVNTKIRQIVANAFGIDWNDVIIMPTSTEKNHNTSPTAASSGSDINGAAALMAAEKIKSRMAQVFLKHLAEEKSEIELSPSYDISNVEFKNFKVIDKKSGKELSFKKLSEICYMNRISLGDYAFYKTPDLNFDKEKGEGKAFNYFTNGMAISEVIIDKLTGECKVLRTDILMDLGRKINPGIDKGQVAGAFVQGMGWVMLEELVYKLNGELLSHSPTTYKIPNVQDTPRIFNINFIENHNNIQNVARSKAVGEPPFLLCFSVLNAIKDALSYLNPTTIPQIKIPATGEEILMTMEKLKHANP